MPVKYGNYQLYEHHELDESQLELAINSHRQLSAARSDYKSRCLMTKNTILEIFVTNTIKSYKLHFLNFVKNFLSINLGN